SRHRTGRTYTWSDEPKANSVEDAPAWAVEILRQVPRSVTAQPVAIPALPPAIILAAVPVSQRIKRLILEGHDPTRYPTPSEARTVPPRPKGRVPDDLKAALTEQIAEVIAVLEKERRPVERAEGDTRPRLSGVVRDLKEDGASVWPVIQKANDPPYLFTRG